MAHWDNNKRAWRIVAEAPRVEGEKRRRLVRYVHAGHDTAGERRAIAGEVNLRDGVTAGRVGVRTGTFGDGARAWQRRARGKRGPWSPSVRRLVADALRHRILPALGDRPAGAITAAEIENLYTEWADELAPSTIRRYHGMIRKIYADLERLGEVPPEGNPMHRVEAGGAPAPERMHMPTADDVHALADTAGERSPLGALWVYIAAYTGIRRGSVLALKWRDFDLEAGVVYVERALALGDDGRQHVKGTKGRRTYPVRLRGRVLELLREAYARAAETALALGERARLGDLYLFSSDGGFTPWSTSYPSKLFRVAARTLGLSWPAGADRDGGMTLHDLRHYAASTQLAAGVPVGVVAQRLGCTIANVQRTYWHYIPSREDERAAEVMAEVLG